MNSRLPGIIHRGTLIGFYDFERFISMCIYVCILNVRPQILEQMTAGNTPR